MDRYYIEKFLSQNRFYIKSEVLEIADSHYSKQFALNNDVNFNVLHFTDNNKQATIVGDLTDITTLPQERIDCFICTQTYNFIYNVQDAIKGSHYLLKKNGTLLATVAGISPISHYDMSRWGDYWRFTSASVKELFGTVFGYDNVQVCVYGNVLAATALLRGLALEDIPDTTLLDDHDNNYQVILGVVALKK
ncbi:MAG: hypothetical protein A2X43_10450 [Candidatus Margulisbacteria bacterium GWD2_39_127]|nr:MAG: hypothetical protein A2X43_10450 [Candidatus Margulisbacteria bacterium GWD2_39_127]